MTVRLDDTASSSSFAATTEEHYKSGKFSKREKQAIVEAIERFMRDRGETLQDFIQQFFGNSDSQTDRKKYSSFKELFRHIQSSVCPDRKRSSIYECVRRILNPSNYSGPWNESDDAELLCLYQQHGSKWERIGRCIGRSGRSVRDRYRLISDQERVTRVPWTPEETNKLVDLISTVKSQCTEENNKDTWCWDWIANQLPGRNIWQCRRKFEQIQAVAANNYQIPQWSALSDRCLCNLIINSNASDDSEINWKVIAADPSWPLKFPHRLIYQRWYVLQKRLSPIDLKLPTDERAEVLLSKLDPLVDL